MSKNIKTNGKSSGLQKTKELGFPNIEDIVNKIEKEVLDDKYTSSTTVAPNNHCELIELSDDQQLLVQQWVKLNDLDEHLMTNSLVVRKNKRAIQNRLLEIMSDKQIDSIGVGDVTLRYEVVKRSKPLTLNHVEAQLRKHITDPVKVEKLINNIDKTRGTTTSQKLSKI